MDHVNMSSRAMAAALGVSKTTILRDLKKLHGEDNLSTIVGIDGKSYPGQRLSTELQQAVISKVHELRNDGMSIRAIVLWLDENGLKRSVGWVSNVLRK